MAFKDFLDNNPVRTALALVVATAGATAGVTRYFSTQQQLAKQAQVEKLTAELASIPRGVRGEERFDVRRLVVSPGAPASVPPNDASFSDEGFYADTAAKFWRHAELTEGEFIDSLVSRSLERPSATVQGVLNQSKVHMWRGKPDVMISGSEAVDRLFPYIAVQAIAVSSLGTLWMSLSDAMDEGERSQADSSAAQRLSQLLGSDPVGTIFGSLMIQLMMGNVGFANRQVVILDIQKAENVLYARTLTTFSKVRANGGAPGRYFVWEETMVIGTPRTLYIVKTAVPSPDLSSRAVAFSFVTQWLKDLRISGN